MIHLVLSVQGIFKAGLPLFFILTEEKGVSDSAEIRNTGGWVHVGANNYSREFTQMSSVIGSLNRGLSGGVTKQGEGLIGLLLMEEVRAKHPIWSHSPRDVSRRWKTEGVG